MVPIPTLKPFVDACSQYLNLVTKARISMEKMIAVSKSDGSSDIKNADYEDAKKSFEENCKNASEAYQKFMLVCRRDERR